MEENLKGYFWTAEEVKLKHFGEILISTRDKKQEIIIYGSFSMFELLHQDINFHDDIPCLYGFTKERRYITLIGLRIEYASGTLSSDHDNSAFKAEYRLSFRQLITGPRLFESSNTLNKISISGQFLGGWTKSDPIRRKLTSLESKNKSPSEIYELYQTDPISFPFDSATCLFYDYISTQHKFDINHLEVRQKACFHFEFNEDITTEKLYEFLQKFREFYSLLSGVNLGLDHIQFKDNSGLDFQYEYDLNIFNPHYTSIRSDANHDFENSIGQ